MKNKIVTAPMQLGIFDVIMYAGRRYFDLQSAMISAMQDFYVRKILPPKIVEGSREYNLRDMKRYWERYELQDLYF